MKLLAPFMAAALAAFAAAAAEPQAPKPASTPEGIANFHQVTPSLATAGAPAAADMALLKAAGYKLVVDLRTPDEGIDDERAAAEAAGLVWVNVPVTRAPERAQLDALAAVLDAHPGERTLVHCASNRRASTMVMLDQVINRGAPAAEAKRHVAAIWTPSQPWQEFIDRTLAAPGEAGGAAKPLRAGAGAAITLVHAGQLFDAASGKLLAERTIVIEGDRIRAVEAGFRPAAAGETVVDWKRMTVLPGLIDLHVHLAFESSKGAYEEEFRLDPADAAYRSVRYAERTLAAGFTTVRDLGSRDNVSINLKRAIDAGTVAGPRVWTAGKSIGSTGGHADPTNGRSLALRGDPGPKDGVINGPEDAWQAVRQRYKDGADLIKIMATGGVLSYAKNSQNPQLTEAEIAAVVAAAKDYGFKVAVHAHGAEGIKRAVRAGVDTIDHGTLIDDEGIRLMKQKGVWLVPTISAGRFVAAKAEEPGYLPAIIVPKAKAIGAQIQVTAAKAFKAGVPMAYGTDTGVSAHGDNAREFGWLAEAGVPAAEAIRMATVHAAKALGRDDVGAIEVGRLADLVAVEADPLRDIRALERVAAVMQGGRLVAR